MLKGKRAEYLQTKVKWVALFATHRRTHFSSFIVRLLHRGLYVFPVQRFLDSCRCLPWALNLLLSSFRNKAFREYRAGKQSWLRVNVLVTLFWVLYNPQACSPVAFIYITRNKKQEKKRSLTKIFIKHFLSFACPIFFYFSCMRDQFCILLLRSSGLSFLPLVIKKNSLLSAMFSSH